MVFLRRIKNGIAELVYAVKAFGFYLMSIAKVVMVSNAQMKNAIVQHGRVGTGEG